MNVYIRNISIAIIANIVVFIIGWGCIVPDQMMDNTHLFGLIGNVEVLKGNTSTVFGVCAVMSIAIMVAALVEAIIEDYSRPCRFNPVNPAARAEKPRKAPKISGMRIADPCPEKCEKTPDEDPKTPTLD